MSPDPAAETPKPCDPFAGLPADLLADLQPALDHYAELMAEHRHDWDTPRENAACVCGWKPTRPMRPEQRRRAVGLHVAAAVKRANKVLDVEVDAIIAERSRRRNQ